MSMAIVGLIRTALEIEPGAENEEHFMRFGKPGSAILRPMIEADMCEPSQDIPVNRSHKFRSNQIFFIRPPGDQLRRENKMKPLFWHNNERSRGNCGNIVR